MKTAYTWFGRRLFNKVHPDDQATSIGASIDQTAPTHLAKVLHYARSHSIPENQHIQRTRCAEPAPVSNNQSIYYISLV